MVIISGDYEPEARIEARAERGRPIAAIFGMLKQPGGHPKTIGEIIEAATRRLGRRALRP